MRKPTPKPASALPSDAAGGSPAPIPDVLLALARRKSEDAHQRVLVACEYSGSVRDELFALGWDAWSADLLPTETPGNHIVGDVREILNDGWDMMIAHPPCTHLACSGAAWFEKKRADGRRLTFPLVL